MQWTRDKSGTTVSFSDLVMTAKDWANFGQYLMTQKQNNACLGKFFSEGVENSVATGKKNRSRYGYQSWVFPVNGKAAMVLQGHGGQFIVLDEATNTLTLTISMNEKYKVGNLFSDIGKIAERVSQ
jgi:CubicO group peptidase (beta-lactamase class C family)